MQTIRHGNLISFAERESQRIDDRSYLIEEIDFTMNDDYVLRKRNTLDSRKGGDDSIINSKFNPTLSNIFRTKIKNDDNRDVIDEL
jgi:hypothetical protein